MLTSHFSNTTQYSNYLAIIRPNTPEVQSWDQIICATDPVISSGGGSPTGVCRVTWIQRETRHHCPCSHTTSKCQIVFLLWSRGLFIGSTP